METRVVTDSTDDLAKDIVQRLRKGGDIFLTGAGGTGKTYLTRKILKHFKNPAKLGTTAIAAIAIGGATVHSFFRLGICSTVEELAKQDKMRIQRTADIRGVSLARAEQVMFSKMAKVLEATDLIVIDEISMASAELLDMVHARIKKYGGYRKAPMLAVGDLLQLPPVSEKAHLVFESKNWTFTMVELTEIHRTEDLDFYRVQSKVRFGIYDTEVAEFITKRSTQPQPDSVYLAAVNRTVDAVNHRELIALPGEIEAYEAVVEKHVDTLPDSVINSFIASIPPDRELRLKPQARVIITTNVYDPMSEELLYYNGQKGTFLQYDEESDCLLIDTDDQGIKRVALYPYELGELTEENGSVVMTSQATVKQYPVRLSYSITVHRAQGSTVNGPITINCRDIFSPGQFYVALSRATCANNISIMFFKPEHIFALPKCVEFYRRGRG
jgi:ATP-dependent exoDNAse (exonuclease V) alpha subunit